MIVSAVVALVSIGLAWWCIDNSFTSVRRELTEARTQLSVVRDMRNVLDNVAAEVRSLPGRLQGETKTVEPPPVPKTPTAQTKWDNMYRSYWRQGITCGDLLKKLEGPSAHEPDLADRVILVGWAKDLEARQANVVEWLACDTPLQTLFRSLLSTPWDNEILVKYDKRYAGLIHARRYWVAWAGSGHLTPQDLQLEIAKMQDEVAGGSCRRGWPRSGHSSR